MEDRKIYEEIALRTEGDIYIGVVGPVRTGKSTFIKRFMETLVIPNIENVYRRERARAIRADIAQRHQVACVAANCLELGEEDISGLLKQVLYEFPLKELDLFLPPWVDALPQEHPIKAALYGAIRQGAEQLHRIRDVDWAIGAMRECEQVSQARVTNIDLGTGLAAAVLELPRALFYDTLSQQSGFQIGDDGDLMALLTQLAQVKAEYDKVADALKEVEETGYGIVVPSIDSPVSYTHLTLPTTPYV